MWRWTRIFISVDRRGSSIVEFVLVTSATTKCKLSQRRGRSICFPRRYLTVERSLPSTLGRLHLYSTRSIRQYGRESSTEESCKESSSSHWFASTTEILGRTRHRVLLSTRRLSATPSSIRIVSRRHSRIASVSNHHGLLRTEYEGRLRSNGLLRCR